MELLLELFGGGDRLLFLLNLQVVLFFLLRHCLLRLLQLLGANLEVILHAVVQVVAQLGLKDLLQIAQEVQLVLVGVFA